VYVAWFCVADTVLVTDSAEKISNVVRPSSVATLQVIGVIHPDNTIATAPFGAIISQRAGGEVAAKDQQGICRAIDDIEQLTVIAEGESISGIKLVGKASGIAELIGEGVGQRTGCGNGKDLEFVTYCNCVEKFTVWAHGHVI